MLGKNDDKIVNQDIKKFCEENGIDTSQPIKKLESYVVVITEEMKRKNAMNTASLGIVANAHCSVDAFNKGTFIGHYPPEAVYTMYEKRFGLYVKELTNYIDKYGYDPKLRQEIEDELKEKNPDGKNEVANLVKEITDLIYSGKADAVGKLVKDKAKEAFDHTYKNEIEKATVAEQIRRDKFLKKAKETDELIENQRESLQDQIKKLQQKLSSLPVTGTMPPDNQDWSDISVMTWF